MSQDGNAPGGTGGGCECGSMGTQDSIIMASMKSDRKKMQKCTKFLLYFWILVACIPNGVTLQSATPNVSTQPTSTTKSNSQDLSAEVLSEIIWASDPSLPNYDPDSPAFDEFPDAVNKISDMGVNAIDAADDLAVAIRYPRSDSYLAAQALLKLGPDITGTTIPILIDNLGNKKPTTRVYALILLASVGKRASCAVGNMAPLLWDSDPSVRSATAFALEKTTEQDLVESNQEALIAPTFLAESIFPDLPEGEVVEKARSWWSEQGSKVNWHPSYGICDP